MPDDQYPKVLVLRNYLPVDGKLVLRTSYMSVLRGFLPPTCPDPDLTRIATLTLLCADHRGFCEDVERQHESTYEPPDYVRWSRSYFENHVPIAGSSSNHESCPDWSAAWINETVWNPSHLCHTKLFVGSA